MFSCVDYLFLLIITFLNSDQQGKKVIDEIQKDEKLRVLSVTNAKVFISVSKGASDDKVESDGRTYYEPALLTYIFGFTVEMQY
jgi:hypothetical protein